MMDKLFNPTFILLDDITAPKSGDSHLGNEDDPTEDFPVSISGDFSSDFTEGGE